MARAIRTAAAPLGFAALFFATGACRSDANATPGIAGDGSPARPLATTSAIAASAASATPGAREPRVVFFGDSLTAGYGLDADQAFPALVGKRLAADGVAARIVNAGVSGDTTTGGASRLDWVLRQSPDVLVVELGANDGLRGTDLDETEKNLRAIVTRGRAAGADVVLLGMQMPPSHGPEYTARFRDLFPRIARELQVPLVPFLLDGVGGNAALNQADGIHPNVEGERLLAENVYPAVKKALADRAAKQR